MKNKKIISLPISTETLHVIDMSVAKLGVSRSELIRRLIDKNIDSAITDEDNTTLTLSLPLELQNIVKEMAKKIGCNVSDVIKKLIERYLVFLNIDSKEIPVLFKIPSELKGKETELKEWLHQRSNAIAAKLSE
jgi:metal-responsive CopG/Arc/MetJ family transcriptional regulator